MVHAKLHALRKVRPVRAAPACAAQLYSLISLVVSIKALQEPPRLIRPEFHFIALLTLSGVCQALKHDYCLFSPLSNFSSPILELRGSVFLLSDVVIASRGGLRIFRKWNSRMEFASRKGFGHVCVTEWGIRVLISDLSILPAVHKLPHGSSVSRYRGDPRVNELHETSSSSLYHFPAFPSFSFWQRSFRYHQQFRRNDAEKDFSTLLTHAHGGYVFDSFASQVSEVQVARWILRVKADKGWRRGCYSLASTIHRLKIRFQHEVGRFDDFCLFLALP